MAIVRELIGMLVCDTRLKNEGVWASWVNTGGGCMAVQVQFGAMVGPHVWKYEILITGRDDVFSEGDQRTDDDVSGFNAILRVYDSEEELFPDEAAVTVYCTSDDAGFTLSEAWGDDTIKAVDLGEEARRVFNAVKHVVVSVQRAERVGRFTAWLW